MEIQEIETENGILFLIKGTLSGMHKSTFHLYEAVSHWIEKGSKGIVLDLKNVIFVDSISIGLLIGVLLKAKENNVLFRFQNIPHQLGHIFEVTQLKKIFPELY